MSTELQQMTQALQAEIDRRQQAEKALEARELEFIDFVENASMGLRQVAADGTIIWANKAELDLLGYEEIEYIGQHIAKFHVDEPVINDILFQLSSGKTIIDHSARLRCKDGSIKNVLIHSNGRFDGDRLRYTRCFTRDVTDKVAREKMVEEREALLDELKIASRAKDEFLAMLGHELRNPLAPIVTALDLMKRRGELTTSKEQNIIQRQVNHMVRLVDDLLDVSKITRGTVNLRLEKIEFSQVLSNAVEMVTLLAEQHEHTLLVDFPQTGLPLHGDPARLTQVISNLLTNAVRYSPKGSRIELRAARAGDSVQVVVKDNGQGIAPELLPRIFDLFFQVPQNQERAQGGLGIGLTLVKTLVSAHGGSVEGFSAGLGQGSQFVIQLPLADHAKLTAPETKPASQIARSSRRVMVVDDNHDAADLLSEILSLSGHETAVAYDPGSALKLAELFKPEVIFLDIGLPAMTGYELAEQMRAELESMENCRMFALTGFGQEIDRINSAKAGFEAHLVKPIDITAILAVIDHVN